MGASQETPLSVFLLKNGLKQIDLSRYLGVNKSHVSLAANGHAKIPLGWLFKLQNNSNGWDTSMLDGIHGEGSNQGIIVNGDNAHSIHQNNDNRQYFSDSPDVLRATIDLLEERIKEKDAQIKEKDAQINKLLNILENK